MELNRREIYRYLGYGAAEPDERIKQIIEDCIAQLSRVISPRYVTRRFPLQILSGHRLDFTCFQVISEDLEKNLQGCDEVILFAASLGTGPDFLMQRYGRLDMSRAVILQAAAAAMIEAYCDEKNEALKKEELAKGRGLRPRYSPGYGDFSLTYQKEICRILAAEKTAGITLTDSLLMLPSKSVTAVIGAGKPETMEKGQKLCGLGGCAGCQKEDCLYRKK